MRLVTMACACVNDEHARAMYFGLQTAAAFEDGPSRPHGRAGWDFLVARLLAATVCACLLHILSGRLGYFQAHIGPICRSLARAYLHARMRPCVCVFLVCVRLRKALYCRPNGRIYF